MVKRTFTGSIIYLILVCTIGVPCSLFAQFKVTLPINRMVIQRDAANKASVQIAGSYSQALDLVEARAVVRVAGQGNTTAWTTLDASPSNGQFNGSINVTGGWYTIQVRGSKSGVQVAVDSVERFGVGEVFAIIGHSNAQGSSCIVDGVNKCPTIGGAVDERVNVIAIDQYSAATLQYQNTADNHYLPGLAFSQLLTRSGSSPFGEIAWLWGRMGDQLVSQINVPVLFYNAGFGGTNMEITYDAAYDIPFAHGFCRYDLRMPYVNLRNVMNLYVPTTGIRAVLIQHGENDRFSSTDLIYKYYTKVIDKIRTEFNKPDLGCIVALSSFVSARYDNVRAAQLQVINLPNYKVYLGPDLDNVNSSADRPDGIHFSPTGQVKAGDLWAAAINSVWSLLTPYPALAQPLVSLSCAGSNQLMLSQPAGYQYEWDSGSTLQNLTVGAGSYAARIKNGQSQLFFPPAVVVPATVQPGPPVVTTDNGTWNICRTTGLKLSSSYAGLNNWSTGITSSTLVALAPGTYTVQAKHPVYSCLSPVVSQTVGLASVNLDLAMQTSKRVVMTNDTVSFRLIVRNKSNCDAGPITLTSRLPPNVLAVATSTGMTIASNVVSKSLSGLLAGATLQQQYTAQLTANGYYRTSAEITATANVDVNATANNGTANGEDDEALVDLRTTAASANVYESPNPKQGLLPAVRSNQPAPNPAKADLSLQIQMSRMAAVVDQLVDVTLTVWNQGGLAATNVSVRDVLPANMQFVSSNSGMTAIGAIVSGNISQIGIGQLATLTFTARVINNGFALNQAQIMSADQADSDSTPGNGYTNGEDDQASLTLRTLN